LRTRKDVQGSRKKVSGWEHQNTRELKRKSWLGTCRKGRKGEVTFRTNALNKTRF